MLSIAHMFKRSHNGDGVTCVDGVTTYNYDLCQQELKFSLLFASKILMHYQEINPATQLNQSDTK